MSKLTLNTETLRQLNDSQLDNIAGGPLGTRMCGVYIETRTWEISGDYLCDVKYPHISLESFCETGCR